eukprot:5375833-Pleurochrysis_carterae.AAC.1
MLTRAGARPGQNSDHDSARRVARSVADMIWPLYVSLTDFLRSPQDDAITWIFLCSTHRSRSTR